MNTKTLSYLIGAALVALVAAVAINVSNRPQSEASEQSKPLLPQLHDHVNDVSAITLTGAEAKVLVTLKRAGDGSWTVAEKSGYPADLTKIREFLLKLDQATLLEQKTSNAARYPDLGVDDVKGKDAKGILVEIAGLAQPVKLIVGNYNGAGGGGTFVRRDGETQSWLAKGNLGVDKNVATWEKLDLVDIASGRLAAVTLTSPDGKVLAIAKDQPADSNFKIADVPKGRETSSEFAANGLASTLATLKADDVLPARDAAPPEKVYKADYATFDGLVVSVTAWEKDSKDYAQFAAKLDNAAAKARIDNDQAKTKAQYDAAVAAAAKAEVKPPATAPAEVPKPLAVSDPAKDSQDQLAALAREAADLNKSFSGWTFILPSFKFSNINKSMDDMLKPLETKKTDAKDAAKTAVKAAPAPKPVAR
jgi:Domain of unknown function (DUF4340)